MVNYRELMKRVRDMSPAEKAKHRNEIRRALKIRLDEVSNDEDKPTIGKLWRAADAKSNS